MSKLPQVFQGLSPRDWSRVREVAATLGRDEEEAVMLSVGYIDVGKASGGQAYVGAMSFDAKGGGGLAYRKVPVMVWPGAAPASADAASGRGRYGTAGGYFNDLREAKAWALSHSRAVRGRAEVYDHSGQYAQRVALYDNGRALTP